MAIGFEVTTSTTSKRKTMSGISSILSQVIAPRMIRRCFFASTAWRGRPNSSEDRVFTSTKTSWSRRLSRVTNFPSVRRPEISIEDLVPVVSQMPGREFFAVAAQLQVGSFRLQKQHGTDSFGQARCFRPHGVPSSAAKVERGLRCPTASTRIRRISAIPSGFSLAP